MSVVYSETGGQDLASLMCQNVGLPFSSLAKSSKSVGLFSGGYIGLLSGGSVWSFSSEFIRSSFVFRPSQSFILVFQAFL